MDPRKTEILFGPPGTGKTTELLRIVEDAGQCGVPIATICFIAFTRKAANEAKERAYAKLKVQEEELYWFRTLHSLAFNQQNLNRSQVMGLRDYITLCDKLGLTITYKGISDDGTFTGLTKGDRLFFMENMARQRQMDLKAYWELTPDEDIYWYELERLHKTLVEYKQINDKRDFTDIIQNFVNGDGECPPVRVLIVDEAQDLSSLQWRMVDRLAESVERIYVAGDDDQAIFRWAGADTEHIINLAGHRRVLDQSYRVPGEVQQLAQNVASRISVRVSKQWKPRPAIGTLEYATSIEHIDMGQGTWLLLARNSYLLEEYVSYCTSQGYVFDSSVGSPVRGEVFHAIRSWEALRKGEQVTCHEVKRIYDLMAVRERVAYGFKKKVDELEDREKIDMKTLREKFGLLTEAPWHEAMDKITPEEAQYFLAALQRGEKLLREPRIKIGTIHSFKGGEAENVVLCTDMAERTWHEYQQNPDDEHRVWYVGVTRAKDRLIVLSPQTNRCYDL